MVRKYRKETLLTHRFQYKDCCPDIEMWKNNGIWVKYKWIKNDDGWRWERIWVLKRSDNELEDNEGR